MSTDTPAALPIAAFGGLGAGVWGVAVGGSEAGVAVGLFEPGSSAEFESTSWDTASPGAVWRLSEAGHALTITAAEVDAATSQLTCALELCRVKGHVTLDGCEHEVELGGVRFDSALGRGIDSLRMVAAWLPNLVAVALLAVRPSGASGHDQDAISAVVHGEPEPTTVFDPRLSTTLDRDGAPRRVGVELWLGESEEGDLRPRRTAGEPIRSSAALQRGAVRLDAHALRCHARGEDGAGVYLIARRNGS